MATTKAPVANITSGPNQNSFNQQNYQAYLNQNAATGGKGGLSSSIPFQASPSTGMTPGTLADIAKAGVNREANAAGANYGKLPADAFANISDGSGSTTTYKGAVLGQTKQQRAYTDALQTAQLSMIQQAVKDAQRGAPILMPSKQAYLNAMNTAVGSINTGLNNANAAVSSGLNMSNANLQSALDSLAKNYGLGIDTVKEFGEKGQQSIINSGAQAQEFLANALTTGQNALQPFVDIGPDAMGGYNDFVNQGFDASFSDYQNSPVYQLQMQEGQKALQNAAAARGILQSGQTNKDLVKYTQDYASQQFNNYNATKYQQLFDRANMGLGAANSFANLGAAIAPVQANTAMQGGLASADLYAGTGNTVGQLYGDLGTRNAATYGDFTNINAGLYAQQAQQAIAAANAIAEQQKYGLLGAGQQVYYTNNFNDTF